MKKEAKFNKIFWVGFIPISMLCAVLVMVILGIFYGLKKDQRAPAGYNGYSRAESHHVCPPPEKVYIHDTVEIKVPQFCNRKHVEEPIKPLATVSETPKDSGNSGDKNPDK
jgi:hypothetical protein